MKKPFRSYLRKSLLFTFFFTLLFGGGTWYWLQQPLSLSKNKIEFRIPAGSSLRQTVAIIRQSGVEVMELPMVLFTRILGHASVIKAGTYEVSQGTTPLQLINKLAKGEVNQASITFPEGWSFRQWRERMAQHPELVHNSQGLSEQEICQKLNIPQQSLEGLLFPDTYVFNKRSGELELLGFAYRTMQTRLQTEWEQREAGLPIQTPYQALILASIIEKETGSKNDRLSIAAVFVNRLHKGMLLQTDPTVIYGLGTKFDGNLRKVDLLTDTPYNSYTRAGLPPTPIAMPGLAAIQAALHPAKNDYLYFVARGDGTSEFSRTLEEHNRAVDRYQRGGT